MKSELYQKTDGLQEVLLMHLLLINYPIQRTTMELFQKTETTPNGVTITKIYAHPKDMINVGKIIHEIKIIQVPHLHDSEEMFVYHAQNASRDIYEYVPENQERPLVINDMGIISPHMLIEEHRIISQNPAAEELTVKQCGFVYFHEYVLRGSTKIGDWTMTYENNTFTVCYQECNLFMAEGYVLQDSFPLVIFIIRMLAPKLERFPRENYSLTRYSRVR